MDPQDAKLIETYRQHLVGLDLCDEEILRIIKVIISISSNIVDDICREVLSHE